MLFHLKSYLKNTALEIRSARIKFKDHQRKNRGYGGEHEDDLKFLRCDYRHKHIAYSLLRGRKYEEIEKPATDNSPNWDIIKEIQNEYAQDVPACAS